MSVIGDAHGVSKMPVSRCIKIVSKCIANNIKNYIKFPMSAGEKQQVVYDFYDIKEFPLVGEVASCSKHENFICVAVVCE
jgi:hypothetical protein